jgi:hypothetical protein
LWAEDIREQGAEENVLISEGKTREFGENCIMTGFMIRQILLEEDEMGGGEEKLFIVISL